MRLKHKIFFTFCVTLFTFVNAQVNLVSNPSFETYTSCPQNIGGNGDFSDATSWIRVQCSPDYFNPCDASSNNLGVPANAFGNQNALSGLAYAGFYTFSTFQHNANREYIETKFQNPLASGEKYLVSFYVSLADNPQYATNAIGAYFSTGQITGSNCNRLSYIPQILNSDANPLIDKNNWILIEDTLIANGGEQYMTIGNFMLDSLSDTLFLGNSTGWNSSYYYIDSVSVIDIGSTIGIKQFTNKELPVLVYPNPAKDLIYVNARDAVEIELYDLLGNKVIKANEKTINVENLQNGIYFIKVISSAGQFFQQKIIVNH